jgi:hypothetical protein
VPPAVSALTLTIEHVWRERPPCRMNKAVPASNRRGSLTPRRDTCAGQRHDHAGDHVRESLQRASLTAR